MIVEIAIGAAAIVIAGALARALSEQRARRDAERAQRTAAAESADRRPLAVGDVLLHAGDELWLAGLLELDEEGTTIALFRVLESARAGWVARLEAEGSELVLSNDTAEVPEGSVPDRLPIGGHLLSLRRRGRARARAEGEGLPSIGQSARYAILGDASGRTAIVVDFEGAPRIALLGERVERALFDVLPGGGR